VNKRRRAILDALTPAVQFAMDHQPAARDWRSVVGLAVRPRASADAAGELLIYGRIGGGGWFSDGISAGDVAAALKELGSGPVNVRINSGGGDVFDGVAIHSILARHSGTVTVFVDGLAASAASFIMLAGDRVIASRNSFVMIHDAMTGVFGNRQAFARALELLDKVSDNIADMYAEKAGEDVEFWRAKMLENGEDGVWYTGQDALGAGLVDEITGGEDDDEDDVNNLLRGWVNLLPREVAARVENSAPRETEEIEGTSAVAIDVTALNTIMKGVFE
jgi:ATP-dependent protease ClpP protease subunit